MGSAKRAPIPKAEVPVWASPSLPGPAPGPSTDPHSCKPHPNAESSLPEDRAVGHTRLGGLCSPSPGRSSAVVRPCREQATRLSERLSTTSQRNQNSHFSRTVPPEGCPAQRASVCSLGAHSALTGLSPCRLPCEADRLSAHPTAR